MSRDGYGAGREEHRVTEELYRNEFGTILYHPELGILELEWLEGSANLCLAPDEGLENLVSAGGE
jgi:hypothetical protein